MIMGGFHFFRLPTGAPYVALPLESSSPSEFVVPSGRHSRKDEIPIRPVEMSNIPIEILDMITPTEEDLRDKSKSDGLTKLIVLIQTAWFVIQCIVRGIQHLPLTELEIVTLAYAMINFFIYVFWWDKPRNVECPVRVYTTIDMTNHEKETDTEESFTKVISYSVGFQDRFVDISKETSVPMFWSGKPDELLLAGASIAPSLLGSAFGAIHCVAWSSEFPSRAELILWRISCIAMIAVPLIAAFTCVLIRFSISVEDGDDGWITNVAIALSACLVLSAWLYIVARIATLVIAFTTLRALPPTSFSVVDWTTFIPHI